MILRRKNWGMLGKKYMEKLKSCPDFRSEDGEFFNCVKATILGNGNPSCRSRCVILYPKVDSIDHSIPSKFINRSSSKPGGFWHLRRVPGNRLFTMALICGISGLVNKIQAEISQNDLSQKHFLIFWAFLKWGIPC